MRSKMLAQRNLLRGGKRAKMAFVNFLGFDVQREMSGQVSLDSGGVIAEIATVRFAVDQRVGIVNVGLVRAVEFVVVHATPLGHGGESLLLRVVFHMRHQGSFFTTRVLAVSALEGLFARVGALMFDERTFRRGGVNADIATEWLLSGVRTKVGRQGSLLGRRVLAKIAFEGLFTRMRSHVFGQRALDGSGVRAKAAFERLFPRVFTYVCG